MKEKKDRKKENNKKIGNWYLFLNLVLVVVLLIGVWKFPDIFKFQFSVDNVILFIVIVNVILLFKDFILVSYGSKNDISHKKFKQLKSLEPLRAFINSSTIIDDKLLKSSIEKLKGISNSEYVEISVLDNNQSNILVSAGTQPQLLAGTRFVLNDRSLSIKHTGQLGVEEISKKIDDYKPVKFKSALTRLKLAVVPLNLSNARLGVCIFYNSIYSINR